MNTSPPTHPARHHLRLAWRHLQGIDWDQPGSAWASWFWTLVVAAGFAFFFTLLAFIFQAGARLELWLDAQLWARALRLNFVISLAVAATINTLFLLLVPALGTPRLRRWSLRRRGLFYSAVSLLGLAIGWPLGAWLVRDELRGRLRLDDPATLIGPLSLGLVISLVTHLYVGARVREADARRQASEARLQLLQAQMEPHFLFNTLAHVQALMAVDPERAREMLETFTDHLRASLGPLRRSEVTLHDELALADSHLRLARLRMEDRLQVHWQVDPSLCDRLLPPLLLQPLVENALLHGLEPAVHGGSVTLGARREGETLVLEVRDDGIGPPAPGRPVRPGHGLALSNLRERLAARWGARAGFELSDAAPGCRATIRLPLAELGVAAASALPPDQPTPWNPAR